MREKKNVFRYFIEEYYGDPENSFTLKTAWTKETLNYVAEDAAEDFYHNHDGWESTWPLNFVILDEDFNELGKFVVNMEAVPSFLAYKHEE